MKNATEVLGPLILALVAMFLLLTRLALYYRAKIRHSSNPNWKRKAFYDVFINTATDFSFFGMLSENEYPQGAIQDVKRYNKIIKYQYMLLGMSFVLLVLLALLHNFGQKIQ